MDISVATGALTEFGQYARMSIATGTLIEFGLIQSGSSLDLGLVFSKYFGSKPARSPIYFDQAQIGI